VENTSRALAATLRPGQLICLESTTYPGTTEEVVKPILEESGLLVAGTYSLHFRRSARIQEIRIIAHEHSESRRADDEVSRELANCYYGAIVDRVIAVPSAATAEAREVDGKHLSLRQYCARQRAQAHLRKDGNQHLGRDRSRFDQAIRIHAVLPGPGLGGHCIPIDPFYLTWKAREYEVPTRFIELAGEINAAEPQQVVNSLASALSSRKRVSVNGARVLLVGVAYKKNVDDLRESPALVIMQDLETRGASVEYLIHDSRNSGDAGTCRAGRSREHRMGPPALRGSI